MVQDTQTIRIQSGFFRLQCKIGQSQRITRTSDCKCSFSLEITTKLLHQHSKVDTYIIASGHTTTNTPNLFRTSKLTVVGPCQYWGGGPPGKPFGCCQLFCINACEIRTPKKYWILRLKVPPNLTMHRCPSILNIWISDPTEELRFRNLLTETKILQYWSTANPCKSIHSIVTVAILAQGTHRANANRRPFY